MATPLDPVVIVSAARTPMGGFLGDLAGLSAPQLGAAAIEAVLKRSALAVEAVEAVLMGCVLQAGLGQAPARQAALGAGLSQHTQCTTLNKMCGSGMQALIMGHDQLLAGSHQALIVGGMESMSNAPYLLDRARAGYRMGHGQTLDHMFLDGLEDAYERGRLMGTFAEDCAEQYGFSRQAQDDYALESLRRAQQAMSEGLFADEITALQAPMGRELRTVSADEQPPKARPEKITTLKPAFRQGGTVTAANASSISDGAAALLLMRQSQAQAQGLPILAKVCAHAGFAHAPNLFTRAPVQAIEQVLSRADWPLESVDLFEINEAFAVVPMVAMHDLGIAHDKLNVFGGACALGHPIGASGARIIVTLLNALRQRGQKRGVAAVCIGGGEATAVAIERL